MAVTTGPPTFDKLEHLQRLVDRGELASLEGRRSDRLGMWVRHLMGGGLLLHGLDHVTERLYPLPHLWSRVLAHDFLKQVVGED
jgi:hypothetical protein